MFEWERRKSSDYSFCIFLSLRLYKEQQKYTEYWHFCSVEVKKKWGII